VRISGRLLAVSEMTAADAAALQISLAALVREEELPSAVELVAGADAAYEPSDAVVHAAAVVWDVQRSATIASATASLPAPRPYVPGLLARRELPALLAAFERLPARPDLVLADGHGRAHPGRCGLACLLGLALDLPTVGCAKEVLVGEYSALARERGAVAPLRHRGETVGAALRTRAGVRPVFVSVGHRITLDRAVTEVLRLARFRLPEPLRAAHHAAVALRRA
jgi:deoxyribonuclease V